MAKYDGSSNFNDVEKDLRVEQISAV